MDIHQDDIRSDLLDILIRDHDIRLRMQKRKEPVTPRDDDLADTSAALIDLQILHPSKTLTIPDVDHILTL